MRVVVVGAGAVGASAALHLARRGHDVAVLEKEPFPALHQSGRSSGVIHAGYNVQPGTAKARYCVDGNRQMHAFCAERRVPVTSGGITVVAQDERGIQTLDELARRAHGNGVRVERLDPQGLEEIEPAARGIAALHAPEASSVDGAAYVRALVAAAQEAGAQFHFDTLVKKWTQDERVTVCTNQGTFQGVAMLNAAGLQADRIAAKMCPDMRIIPFRGFYAKLRPDVDVVRSHIYAAPDLDFPFLGVHLSRRTDGSVWVGPGAMLAFGREAYKLWHISPRDLGGTLAWPGFWRMVAGRRVRKLIRHEVDKSLRLRAIWKEARVLVPSLKPGDLVRATAGNRAQMVDRSGRMVEDIVVRQHGATVHVLNAVSPGLTCSLPFGQALATQVERLETSTT